MTAVAYPAVVTVDYTATLPAKRSAAAALFTNDDGHVLLVEPTYKPYWEIPGGAIEANESPFAAAAREVKEELGLVATLGRLLAVDWVTCAATASPPAGRNAPASRVGDPLGLTGSGEAGAGRRRQSAPVSQPRLGAKIHVMNFCAEGGCAG